MVEVTTDIAIAVVAGFFTYFALWVLGPTHSRLDVGERQRDYCENAALCVAFLLIIVLLRP